MSRTPHCPYVRRFVLGALCLALGCSGSRWSDAARPRTTSREASPPAPTDTLYGAEEALADVLSEPLQHLGTGHWPGIQRMYACAYRNRRVYVVDAYCGVTDRQAFRLLVYSPARGRVGIYAEAKGAVGTRRRADYFTFTVESEPPPAPDRGLPALGEAMRFDALRAYEQQRYEAFLPLCYGGVELSRPREGCLGALASRLPSFRRRHRAFLAGASDDWYRAVATLRALAVRHGREPD